MFYISHWLTTPLTAITDRWNNWKTAYHETVTNYYNQRIELNPEGEAREYWERLKHPQSGFNLHDMSDSSLCQLMHTLLQQGISEFAVDRFIMELRRLKRNWVS